MGNIKTVSPQHVRDHVDTVAKHEKEFLEERSAADRLAMESRDLPEVFASSWFTYFGSAAGC